MTCAHAGGANAEIVSGPFGSVGLKELPPLVAAVGRCVERFGLPPSGVVAVSGGPDSVALLLALVKLRGPAPAGPLVIAHFNHQLRGAESDADEAFVRGLYESLLAQGTPGLDLRCDRSDLRAEATNQGANLEDLGRLVRYVGLQEVALDASLAWVATGHTANDQAETVLHRLLRGAGLKGLRGIAARRPVFVSSSIRLVRPLLAVTRSDVLAYLERERQPFRQDSSNLDLDYTRNRIRHELLPDLAERYNPAIVQVLGRLAAQAEEVYQHEEEAARALLAAAERPRAGSVLIFDRRSLAAAPRHRVREAFRLAWDRQGWPLGGMGFDDWERLAGQVHGRPLAPDQPGGVRARALPNVVQLGRLP
jgi:tRNA(Ile)-lysidine synthase